MSWFWSPLEWKKCDRKCSRLTLFLHVRSPESQVGHIGSHSSVLIRISSCVFIHLWIQGRVSTTVLRLRSECLIFSSSWINILFYFISLRLISLAFFFYFLVCASAEYTGNYKFVMICGDSNDSSCPSVTDFLTSNQRIQLTTRVSSHKLTVLVRD